MTIICFKIFLYLATINILSDLSIIFRGATRPLLSVSDPAWVKIEASLVRLGSGIGPRFSKFCPFPLRPMAQMPGVLVQALDKMVVNALQGLNNRV